MVGDLRHGNYSNTSELARHFVVHTLRRWLVAWEQAGVATAANGALSVWTLQACLLGLSQARQHIIKQRGKLIQAQTGHAQKNSLMAAQIVKAADHSEPQVY